MNDWVALYSMGALVSGMLLSIPASICLERASTTRVVVTLLLAAALWPLVLVFAAVTSIGDQ